MAAQLKPGVCWVDQADGILVIDTLGDAPTLKISRQLRQALQFLQQSTDAGTAPAELPSLLPVLQRYGLLRNTELQPELKQQQRRGSWRLPSPDPLAKVLAAWLTLLPRSVRAIAWYAPLPLLVLAYWLTNPEYATPSAWLLCWLPLSWFAHELSHAIACRFYQVPVSGMGIRWQGRLFPTPFVSTKALPLQTHAVARARIALAGPWCDAWLAALWLASTPWAGNTGVWLCTMQLSLLLSNLSPFRQSDGYQALRQGNTDALGQLNPAFSKQLRGSRWLYATLLLVPTSALLLWWLVGVSQ
ncbi:MAG TPA: hypothetical protein DCS87_01505 [Rheinheimera sp.]|nr:hypothetical protein [Rheinheimera sp.]